MRQWVNEWKYIWRGKSCFVLKLHSATFSFLFADKVHLTNQSIHAKYLKKWWMDTKLRFLYSSNPERIVLVLSFFKQIASVVNLEQKGNELARSKGYWCAKFSRRSGLFKDKTNTKISIWNFYFSVRRDNVALSIRHGKITMMMDNDEYFFHSV